MNKESLDEGRVNLFMKQQFERDLRKKKLTYKKNCPSCQNIEQEEQICSDDSHSTRFKRKTIMLELAFHVI